MRDRFGRGRRFPREVIVSWQRNLWLPAFSRKSTGDFRLKAEAAGLRPLKAEVARLTPDWFSRLDSRHEPRDQPNHQNNHDDADPHTRLEDAYGELASSDLGSEDQDQR
jgi:hypothetical protein